MHLLKQDSNGEISITSDLVAEVPAYAILSHTWGLDGEEVTFRDLSDQTGTRKKGYAKIEFCQRQAAKDGLRYFWIDTCCIDKSSSAELTEAINSMFRWYRQASKCYVYLSDVPDGDKSAFGESRWFTRSWTLQELLAPEIVDFFSVGGKRIGDKGSLERKITKATGIPSKALQGQPLSGFGVGERMSWTTNRTATRKEDEAYCLLDIFDVHLPLIYGEGENAWVRLHEAIEKRSNGEQSRIFANVVLTACRVHESIVVSPIARDNLTVTAKDPLSPEQYQNAFQTAAAKSPASSATNCFTEVKEYRPAMFSSKRIRCTKCGWDYIRNCTGSNYASPVESADGRRVHFEYIWKRFHCKKSNESLFRCFLCPGEKPGDWAKLRRHVGGHHTYDEICGDEDCQVHWV